jgi:hypothetical protein
MYPAVFCAKGVVFMIPETSRCRSLNKADRTVEDKRSGRRDRAEVCDCADSGVAVNDREE